MLLESYDMGSYNLHLIKTKKFKTISIEIHFRRLEKKEETTIRNLLKLALINSSLNYKTLKDLIIASEDLYDIKVFGSLSRIGNYSDLAIKAKFLNEKYTEKDMNSESIKFIFDLIFKPNVSNNSFNDIDNIVEKLKNSINLVQDNKLKYAILKLFETTKNMPYSYNTMGNLEDLEKIDGTKLYEYYQSVIKEDLVDVYVVGDFENEKIKEIFREYFQVRTFKKQNCNFIVKELPLRRRIVKYKEYDDVNQSQVTVLCNLRNLTLHERNYVIKVYSHILGGSTNSILFQNIREKNSYAYYVNADVKPYDNIMVIYSGVEKENIDKVLKLMKNSLITMEKGQFSDDDLKAAISTMISSVEASLDTPFGMITSCMSQVLINKDTTSEKIKKYENITRNDIINVAKKVKMHTVLTLEQGGNNEKDNT